MQLRLPAAELKAVNDACLRCAYPTYASAGRVVPLDQHRRGVGDNSCQVGEALDEEILQLVYTVLPVIACSLLLKDPLVSAVLFLFSFISRLMAEEHQSDRRGDAAVHLLQQLGPHWEEVLGERMCTFKTHVRILLLD